MRLRILHTPYLLRSVLLLALSLCASSGTIADTPAIRSPFNFQTQFTHNPTLVTIDDSLPILFSDLFNRLDSSDLALNGGVIDSAACYDTLKNIIFDSLNNFVADTISLLEDSVQNADYNEALDGLKVRIFGLTLVDTLRELDSASVDSFYYANEEIFAQPSRVDFSHILVAPSWYRHGPDSADYASYTDEQIDSIAKARANALRREVTDSITFAAVARSSSMDFGTSEKGGRMGWNEISTIHAELEKVMYDSTVPLHQVIGPVASREGYHLLYLHDRFYRGLLPITKESFLYAYNSYSANLFYLRGRAVIDSTLKNRRFTPLEKTLARPAMELRNDMPVGVGKNLDTVFARDYLTSAFSYWGPAPERDTLTMDQKRDIVIAIAARKVLLRLANEAQVDTITEFRQDQRGLRRIYAHQTIGNSIMRSLPAVDDARVNAFYNDHLEEYTPSRPYRIVRILAKDLDHAEHAYHQLIAGADPLRLADEVSPGSAKRETYIKPDFFGADFEDSAIYNRVTKMRIAEVSAPVKCKGGYCTFKLVERKDVLKPSEAAVFIRQRLIEEDRKAALLAWRQKVLAPHKLDFAQVELPGVQLRSKKARQLANIAELRDRNYARLPKYAQ